MKRFVHEAYDPAFDQLINRFDPKQIEYGYSYLTDINDDLSFSQKYSRSREESAAHLKEIKEDYQMWLDNYSLDVRSFDELCRLLSKINLDKVKQFLVDQGIMQ